MSNAIFPALPGLKWGRSKTPVWSTRIQTAESGREWRAARYSYPVWRFKLNYEFLRAGSQQELQSLVGFFNARQGSYDSFLYDDPRDNTATAQTFGTGDGSSRVFQLVRTLGDFVEPVKALQAPPSIFNNGVLQSSGVSVDLANAIVTFAVAPAAGHTLAWTGLFYFRCRFLQDSIDFEEFLKDLWQAKKVEFTSIK
jgi:uncharacterized protein (TIGR02217 family)